ncbi:MAG: ABC transporter ATP-binding protein [Ignavibacteria bacterium]|nr:ABC transporter ATP-binding protein [Ignavibacteria bacterium]
MQRKKTACLEAVNISKKFNGTNVLTEINLTVEKGEFFSIVGPSGCGKTTLLRIIAGLEFPDAGKIIINNIDSTGFTPQKRKTGIVFQNYALFPNMTVYENVAYGLEVKKTDKNIIREKVYSVLEKVQISHKSDVSVTTLSGGEQQRVSLARVIVTEPDLILFDEPLSNLDYSLRLETRNELKRLQREAGITSVYVTHDQTEALALSDRIAVLNNGVIQQTGNPFDVYYNPENSFVAGFIGHSNFFNDVMSGDIFNVSIKPGEKLCVLPEEVIPVSGEGKDYGLITDVQFTGFSVEYTVEIRNQLIKSIQSSGNSKPEFSAGDKAGLKLLTSKARILK